MKSFDPKKMSPGEILQLFLGGIAPRPIALVSTLSKNGVHNLAPFSFFNGFGCNPPIVVFSPAHRGRDGSAKDTYTNLMDTQECVVQAVTYDIAEQVNVASGDFTADVDEFKKSGLTPIDSVKVKAKRVKESPFHIECKLHKMISFEEKPGSGNLAICEGIYFHVDERVFDGKMIHPDKIDLVGRNSGPYYTRASGSAIFSIPKPVSGQIIGYDGLPNFVKKSKLLTGNDLGRLGNREMIPSKTEVSKLLDDSKPIDATKDQFKIFEKENNFQKMFQAALSIRKQGLKNAQDFFERTAQIALKQHDDDFAWKALLASQLQR